MTNQTTVGIRVAHFLVSDFPGRKQEKCLISCQETPGKPETSIAVSSGGARS